MLNYFHSILFFIHPFTCFYITPTLSPTFVTTHESENTIEVEHIGKFTNEDILNELKNINSPISNLNSNIEYSNLLARLSKYNEETTYYADYISKAFKQISQFNGHQQTLKEATTPSRRRLQRLSFKSRSY